MASTITAKEAYGLLKGGEAVLIDVREADEFKTRHIPYALSIPLASVEDGIAKLKIPTDKKVLFQCLKGKRGEMACDKVCGKDMITNEVYNIQGGIDAWEEAELPLIKSGGAKLSIFRQVQIILGFMLIVLIGAGIMGSMAALYLAIVFSTAFFIAGLTGFCGLAALLSKMPWNK